VASLLIWSPSSWQTFSISSHLHPYTSTLVNVLSPFLTLIYEAVDLQYSASAKVTFGLAVLNLFSFKITSLSHI
jgi:hypothetical protein